MPLPIPRVDPVLIAPGMAITARLLGSRASGRGGSIPLIERYGHGWDPYRLWSNQSIRPPRQSITM